MGLGLLIASASFGIAPLAWAQVPVFQAPLADPAPSSASSDAPEEGAAPTEVSPAPDAVAEPLPPPPIAPVGAVSADPPAPAKTRVISTHRLSDAREEDDAEPELKPRQVWYGWQTLVADSASLGSLLVGAEDDRNGGVAEHLATAGLLGYVFAPGIIHFVHRNPGRGFASMGIRIGMPLAGGILGASLASGCDGFLCEANGAAIGLLLGMGGAIAIDAAVFAYDERPARAARAKRLVTPLVSVLPGRAFVGLVGEL